MRETELWQRLHEHLGGAYAQVWAEQVSLATLGNRTVGEALRAGLSSKQIWRAVHEHLELPSRLR